MPKFAKKRVFDARKGVIRGGISLNASIAKALALHVWNFMLAKHLVPFLYILELRFKCIVPHLYFETRFGQE